MYSDSSSYGRGLVADYAATTLSDRETDDLNEPSRTTGLDSFDGGTDLRDIADRAIGPICKMLQTGILGRQPRYEMIRKNEDMYNGNTPPALRGRSNVPFDCVVMQGFIDALLSETDEPVDIQYGPAQQKGLKASKRLTALIKEESGPNKGDWDPTIQDSKFLGSLSGRFWLKFVSDNVPDFNTKLYVPDHYDMVTEPKGGANLDHHLFKFEMNIFRTKSHIRDDMKQGFYDAKQCAKLFGSAATPEEKKDDDDYKNKLDRFAAFNTDIEQVSYVGQPLFNMCEGVVSINHRWFYIFFHQQSQTWIRFCDLKDAFPWAERFSGRGGWISAAPYRHPFIFNTKAPADNIRGIAYTMKKILNLTIDNLEKNVWNMQAYDPRIFTDPEKLLYKQDNLVRATLRQGQKISDGIFQFKTEDNTQITVNLVQALDGLLGKKLGLPIDSQGEAPASMPVGVNVSNIAQMSKRMKLANRQFSKMIYDLGGMFDWAAYKYVREPIAVKLIGIEGADWDETFTKDDAEQDFNVIVRGGIDDQAISEAMAGKREKFFANILQPQSPVAGSVNKEIAVRMQGRDAKISEDDLDLLLDTQNASDADTLADAAQAIDDCINKRPYRLYRDANISFIKKIVDYARRHYQVIPTDQYNKLTKRQKKDYDDEMLEYDALMKLVAMHMPFVKKNAQDDIQLQAMTQGLTLPQGTPGAPAAPNRITPEMLATMGGGAPAPAAPLPNGNPAGVPAPVLPPAPVGVQ